MSVWSAVVPGDLVRLRPKRRAGELQTVTVAGLLEKHWADGPGLVDEEGAIFRQFYYDVEILPTPAP